MRKQLCLFIFLTMFLHIHGQIELIEERSVLVILLKLLKQFKHNILKKMVESPESRKLLKLNNKTLEVSSNTTFPCGLKNITRSTDIPKNAHQVRPGDIDVIGGIGDSLTAAFGASANTLFEVFVQNRGRSFSVGGEGTWRTSLTLPNILKMFNPNIIGYSLETSTTLDKESQFNVAEGGAISAHMPFMTKRLVQRIKADPRVNLEKDWKMITVMIGGNDFCLKVCYQNYSEDILLQHKLDILNVLRILRTNLPRTIVNVVPPPHLRLLAEMKDKPNICQLLQLVECPCLSDVFRRKLFYDLMKRWQKLDIEVANYPEFDLDDFTVIPHHFPLEYTLPVTEDGRVDYSSFSKDCFHFSQKGQSRYANNLWNSLLEPFGNKSTNGFDPFSVFRCPSSEFPYIFTRRNSPQRFA